MPARVSLLAHTRQTVLPLQGRVPANRFRFVIPGQVPRERMRATRVNPPTKYMIDRKCFILEQ